MSRRGFLGRIAAAGTAAVLPMKFGLPKVMELPLHYVIDPMPGWPAWVQTKVINYTIRKAARNKKGVLWRPGEYLVDSSIEFVKDSDCCMTKANVSTTNWFKGAIFKIHPNSKARMHDCNFTVNGVADAFLVIG